MAPTMPTFFSFQQGSEASHLRSNTDSSPLLGRFRAVPRPEPPGPRRSGTQSQTRLGLLSSGWRGSVHVGYGTLLATELEEDEDEQEEDNRIGGRGDGGLGPETDVYYDKAGLVLLLWRCRRWARRMEDTWVTPRASAVKRVVDLWWSRWTVLVVLPASLVSHPRSYRVNVGRLRKRPD